MLKLWTTRRDEGAEWYEQLFLERYDRISAWALQLTKGQTHLAEDLVQDAFIFLVQSQPEFASARNIDAYLYGILRNLHRAQLQRAIRQQQMALPILEYESAEWGLAALNDREALIIAQNDLRHICHFACHRKESAKAGSILILRFFHGYYAAEIAAIARCSRAAVDERLRQARREAKVCLDDPAKFQVLGAHIPPFHNLHNDVLSTDALLAELRHRIFAAVSGPCLNRSQIRSMYGSEDGGPSGAGVDQSALAHIVSCQKCLDAVTSRLRLAPFSDRDPNDSAGYDSGRFSTPSTKGPQLAKRLVKWRRAAEGVRQHEPKQLWLAVNGQPMGCHAIAADQNDFSVSVALKEEIEFIEILSEQQIRLLLMPVTKRPPEGDSVQHAGVKLSDGRELSVKLSFDSPWPAVHTSFANRQLRGVVPEDAKSERSEPQLPLFRSLFPSPSFAWRRVLGSALALLLIMALLVMQNRQNTASAAAIVEHALAWERLRADTEGLVLHRSFDFTERKHGQGSVQRRVETWRRKGLKITRMFDASGRLLASETTTAPLIPLNSGTVWQFEPSAETYRSVAGDLRSSTVRTDQNSIQLESKSADLVADLWVDKASYRPVRETLQTADCAYEFREMSTETVPDAASPFAANVRPLGEVRVTVPRSPSPLPDLPATVRETELDSAEAALWVELHAKNADLGEEISVRRREQEIELAGVVDSEERKRELITALEAIPHVRISLLSPEDVSVSGSVTDRVKSALASMPEGSTAVHPPLLADWLATHHPNSAERPVWISHVLELSRECLRRAYALRMLSDRYPNPDRAEIVQIVRDHQRALMDNWKALSEVWQPVTLDGPTPNPPPAARLDIRGLFERMRSLRTHMLNLVAADASGGSVMDLSSELRLCREDWGALDEAIGSLTNRN